MFNRGSMPSSVDSFVELITGFYINAMDNLKVSLKIPSAQAMYNDSYGSKDTTKRYTESLTEVLADSIEHNVSFSE